MKHSTVLLFAVVLIMCNVAYSKSVIEAKDNPDDNGIERSQDDVEKRGYYWVVSPWGPCKCNGDLETGIQSRVVTCTQKPCHFIRGPRRHQVCQCF